MAPDHFVAEVVGEPFVSRVAAYRAELQRVHDVWLQWAVSQGGTPSNGYRQGLFFIGAEPKEPTQWRRKDRAGWAVPKKGSAAEAAMKGLPRKPSTFDVFPEVPGTITYRDPARTDAWGSEVIGRMFGGPSLGWCGDRIFVCLPDCRTARVRVLQENPGWTVDEPCATWQVPAGLNEITEVYYRFVMAEFELKREEARKNGNQDNRLSAV